MPEWILRGGLVGGGLVYEHENGARAYIHVNEDGAIDVAGWDPGSGHERQFPNREALDTIVAMDIEGMRQSDRGEDKAALALAGIGEFAAVRSYRGRRKRWDRASLAMFVKDVLEHGLRSASEQCGVKERRGLELMWEAERQGLVRIQKTGGHRSRNVYTLIDEADAWETSADWHRRRWLALPAEARKPARRR